MINLIAILTLISSVQHTRNDRITQAELMVYLVKQAACPKGIANPVSLDSAKHADLTQDGRDNVIVVGSTCNTGTAGPDIHSVFSRNDDGDLVELPIENQDKPDSSARRVLFGNANYDLFAEKDELIADFGDTSEREHPLVIRYRWDGKQFREVGRKAAGTFPTSYDCAKATQEVEQAICAVQNLARLDVALNTAYMNAMRKLSAERKLKLQSDQRAWLKKRNSTCAIYKWWIDCLADLYTMRIEEIQSE